MSKFVCEKCQTYPCILDTGDGSTSPFYCPFWGKEKNGWIEESEEIEPQKPPVYYTLPAPAAEPEIDYKKLSKILCKAFGNNEFSYCSVCRTVGGRCDDGGHCGDIIIAAAKLKCTKGGE
jgi:hypothetical protein